MKKKQWTKEAICSLIEAYKEQSCLYAVNTPNYHNKHLRSEALQKVCAAVSLVRPGTTEKECSTKVHNVRNQFNIENVKVKASIKSGAGTDDVCNKVTVIFIIFYNRNHSQCYVTTIFFRVTFFSQFFYLQIYRPSLWYFNDLKYLDSYFIPRKSRNSIETKCAKKSVTTTEVKYDYVLVINTWKFTSLYNVHYVHYDVFFSCIVCIE